jgi:hypothetical protein
MRSKIWIFLICVHCLAFAAAAQSPAKRQLVLPVTTGGFVSFRSETSAPADAQMKANSLSALLFSQAIAGDNRVIHRVLTDAERRVVFAYDVAINSDPIAKKFSLKVLPADEAFRRSFLKDSAPLRAHEGFATFPNATTAQTLDDGDAVSLELLVNRESGVKIVDLVKVTFDRSSLRDSYLEAAPKDFSLDAVSLSVRSYELMIDGTPVGKSKSKLGCAGSLLWIYIPDRGRFIFSLVPREGYAFQKIGLLDDNRIEFEYNGEFYEWISGDSILPNGGVWNLWVLHDRDYTSWLDARQNAPRSVQKEPNVFQKLEDRLLTQQGITLMRNGRPANGKQSIDTPQRVTIGGADSMEHLLPMNFNRNRN